MTTDTYTGGLDGAVIAVAGAGGPAGRAVLHRLARAGSHVIAADADPQRLAEAVDAAQYDAGGADITGEVVDLLGRTAQSKGIALDLAPHETVIVSGLRAGVTHVPQLVLHHEVGIAGAARDRHRLTDPAGRGRGSRRR